MNFLRAMKGLYSAAVVALVAVACGEQAAPPVAAVDASTLPSDSGRSSPTDGGSASDPDAPIAPPPDDGGAPVGPGTRLTTDLGVPCGDTDVAAQINEALAGLPGGTLVWLECVYLVGSTVLVPEGLTIAKAPEVAEAGVRRTVQGTPPADWPRGVPYFAYLAIRGSDVVVEDLVVRGPLAMRGYEAELETAHAVMVAGAYSNIAIRRLDISGVHGDVFYFGDPDVDHIPSDVLVEDVHSVINGRQAIGLSAGRRLTFRRVTIEQTARSAIDVEPLFTRPPGMVQDLLFEDCAFLDYKNVGFGLHPNTTYRVTIRRTQFRGGIDLARLRSDDMPDATGAVQPPHEDIVLDQVTYDYHSPFPQTSSFAGSVSASGIVRLDVRGASWRVKRPATLNCTSGSGSVTDSAFTSDDPPPSAQVGASMTESGNTGTGPCATGG